MRLAQLVKSGGDGDGGVVGRKSKQEFPVMLLCTVAMHCVVDAGCAFCAHRT